MQNKLFTIKAPQKASVPIIISVPHTGTQFPAHLKKKFNTRVRTYLDDTDWFVDKLYDFAPALGITVIKANLSRWVVDLNRNPDNAPLYNDGRIITSVTPTTDFFGNELYKSKDLQPDAQEIAQRVEAYFRPYHQKIRELITHKKDQFGKVLLWDAHSIRHKVSTIHPTPFPDMILGNNDGKTAHPELIEVALSSLRSNQYEVAHNAPFKGGHITRSFGAPTENIHALQLEMNKILYMDDNELHYNTNRANQVKSLLEHTLRNLIEAMGVVA